MPFVLDAFVLDLSIDPTRARGHQERRQGNPIRDFRDFDLAFDQPVAGLENFRALRPDPQSSRGGGS